MRNRSQFPADLALAVFPYIIVFAIILTTEVTLPLINWFRHPTPTPWLWAVCITLGASLLGASLLFMAKLPAYRGGHFLRIGKRHLPARHQRLYVASFRIIIPALLALATLVVAGQRF